MRASVLILVLIAATVTLATGAQAAGTMNYQGQLLDSMGNPITGTVDMTFYIYDDSAGGSVLWMEERSIEVASGMFDVELGAFGPVPDSAFLYASGSRYLQVVVNGESIGPRAVLTSVPRAFVSRGLSGDVQTRPGFMRVGSDGDPSFIDISGADGLISFVAGGDTVVRISQDEVVLGFADCGLARPAAVSQAKLTSCGIVFGDSTGGTQANVNSDGVVLVSPSVAMAEQVDVALTRAGLMIADGAASGYVLTSDAGGNGMWQPASGGGWVDDGSVARLNTSTDSVGIGTPAPSEKLEVNGNARVVGEVIGGKARFGTGVTNSGVDAFSAGNSNDAFGDYSTVGGGSSNDATGDASTIGGGFDCEASGPNATVGGGSICVASGSAATVAGGSGNAASGSFSTVSGGGLNSAVGSYGTVCGGRAHVNHGDYSSVLGGNGDTLTSGAAFSAVFGQGVSLADAYTVVLFDSVWSGRLAINRDSKNGDISYPIHVGTSTADGNGAHLTQGGTWQNGSSRTFKDNFEPLGADELVTLISELPVAAWKYRGTDERHIGPVAEDFVEAFDVGTVTQDNTRENRYLSPGDVAGVALAGVKELIRENDELRQLISDLKERVEELERKK